MSERDISILNSLLKTTLDSQKGFEEAADDLENSRFASVFREFARDRGEVATMLSAEVRRLGGEPTESSSLLAAAHRTFMDLKQAVTGKDEKAIIEEVERGEDYIKEKFEEALASEELSPETRDLIRAAFRSVREGHDRASALKHSLT